MTTSSRRSGDTLNRWDPFAEMTRLNEALRRYLDTWEREFPAEPDGDFTPLGDLEEADDAFVLQIELPGVEREDVDVEVAGRRVRVAGERRGNDHNGVVRRRARQSGRFLLEVALPGDVDPDGAAATLRDGLLTIRVPKAEVGRRRIAVT
jgi:HSP20 family protein